MKIIRSHTEPLYEQNDGQLAVNILEEAGSRDGSGVELILTQGEEEELVARSGKPVVVYLKEIIATQVQRRFGIHFTAQVAYFRDERRFVTFHPPEPQT